MEQKYSTPDNMRIYAIGDVHGYAVLLDKMHERIAADMDSGVPQDVHIVYLGDYIDRGPDSKGVIDRLIEERDCDDGIGRTFLKGNHEAAMLEFMDEPEANGWLRWGGIEALVSYGIEFVDVTDISSDDKARAAMEMKEKVPASHIEFLNGLDLSVSFGGYFFTHGGVDPLKPFDAQSDWNLMFMREPFLSWHENMMYEPLEKKVVHGHTPALEPEDLPHRIGVDAEAYESGVLTAAVLEGEDVRFCLLYTSPSPRDA